MTSTTRAFLLAMFSVGIAAIAPYAIASDVDELTSQLHEFLAGASVGNAQVHDSFWAEELIYTSSSGTRTNKVEIMQSMREAPESEAGVEDDEPTVIYTAEDIDVRVYGTTAIIAFRLVGISQIDGSVMQYFNTGTYLKRDDAWQVVAWQATKIPESEVGD